MNYIAAMYIMPAEAYIILIPTFKYFDAKVSRLLVLLMFGSRPSTWAASEARG